MVRERKFAGFDSQSPEGFSFVEPLGGGLSESGLILNTNTTLTSKSLRNFLKAFLSAKRKRRGFLLKRSHGSIFGSGQGFRIKEEVSASKNPRKIPQPDDLHLLKASEYG
jgi:hypothetical protein